MSDHLQSHPRLADDTVYSPNVRFALLGCFLIACILDYFLVGPAMAHLLAFRDFSNGWLPTLARIVVPLALVFGEVHIASQLAYYDAPPEPGEKVRYRRYFVAMYIFGVLLALIPAGALLYAYSAALEAMEDPGFIDKLAFFLFPAAAFVAHVAMLVRWKVQRQVFAEFRYNFNCKKLNRNRHMGG